MEPAEEMMKILKDTGIYSIKYQEFLGSGQNTVPEGEVTCWFLRSAVHTYISLVISVVLVNNKEGNPFLLPGLVLSESELLLTQGNL